MLRPTRSTPGSKAATWSILRRRKTRGSRRPLHRPRRMCRPRPCRPGRAIRDGRHRSPIGAAPGLLGDAAAQIAASCPPAQWDLGVTRGVVGRHGKCLGPSPGRARPFFVRQPARGYRESRKASRRVWSSATKTHHKMPEIGGSSLHSTTPYGLLDSRSVSRNAFHGGNQPIDLFLRISRETDGRTVDSNPKRRSEGWAK